MIILRYQFKVPLPRSLEISAAKVNWIYSLSFVVVDVDLDVFQWNNWNGIHESSTSFKSNFFKKGGTYVSSTKVKVLLHSPWIGWAMNQGAHSVLTVSENTGESERSRNGGEKLSGCKNKTVKDFRNKKWCNHYGLHLNRWGEAVGGYEEPQKKASSWGEKKKKRFHGRWRWESVCGSACE